MESEGERLEGAHVAIVLNQAASSTGEVVLLYDFDIEAGFC